ncbi:hypothetical protein SMACR_00459 [Sordaria macrospora]|uniref:Ankyrin repeat protein n=1 Tax=Sordaria macrospora TaxID=5147 RepID=A0A8S8ZR91_SORMA|nr:hypothetical protein SMACR_00459 [Sordaria macrospora]WPJ59209.1 hypothetical protein SMAC4_00459 [Sordaria macrospora]
MFADSYVRKSSQTETAAMPRTKDGKITKPTGESQVRRRGRPAIDWTPSRKRRLLRLYLCTPESGLSLKEILDLLAEGSFQPKPRHTQCLLNELLSKSYRQRRPKNRASMERRLAYLRSLRDGRSASDPPKGDEIDCAILLAKNPSKWRQQSPVPNCPTQTLGREMTRLSISHHLGLEQASANDLSSIPAGSSTATSFDSPEAELMPASDVPASTGRIFKQNSKTIKERRCSRVESLRVKLPGRTSSFLADVVSLLSGLSICSSSNASSCSSPHWNQRSFLSRSNSSATLYEGRGKKKSAMPEGKAMSPEDPINYSDKYVQNADSQANQELLNHCCSKKAWCIHRRISAVCFGNRSADTFVCAAEEVNDQDGLGNTALHVAARWIAPWPVLFRIMTMSTTITLNTPNHLNELFLHVFNPRSLDIDELAHLTKYLVGREFNLCQLDSSGMTFIDRLLTRPDFTIEALEAIFSYLPEATRLFLLRNPSSPSLNPHHTPQPPLIQAIRARLNVIEGNSLIPDPSQLEAASAYCDYFLSRYGTAYRTVWIKPPSLFAHVPVDPQGRNNLHQIVASLNVGRNMCPPTAENLCYYAPPSSTSPPSCPSLSDTSFLDLDLDLDLDVGVGVEPTAIMAVNPHQNLHHQRSPTTSSTISTTSTTTSLSFPNVLALVLSGDHVPEDPNNRDLPHFRTPLMTLLRQFAWGNYSHSHSHYPSPNNMIVECLHLLLARGAQPELVDIDGNNALHHAAELGLLSAVVELCQQNPDLGRVMNRRGQTPLDLAIQRMGVKGYMPMTEGMRRAAGVGRHAEVVLFLETGVVMPGDE